MQVTGYVKKYGHICDRLRENPAYGIIAQIAQCAFIVHQVQNCQSPAFVIFMSKNLSSNCYRRLRRLGVSYQGEISLFFYSPLDLPSLTAASTWSLLWR